MGAKKEEKKKGKLRKKTLGSESSDQVAPPVTLHSPEKNFVRSLSSDNLKVVQTHSGSKTPELSARGRSSYTMESRPRSPSASPGTPKIVVHTPEPTKITKSAAEAPSTPSAALEKSESERASEIVARFYMIGFYVMLAVFVA